MLSLHHIGIVVADISRACQEYASRFGYDICTKVVHDADQTAFVQFLKLPHDLAYVELVSPDGPASKLAAAMERGGGLNHLCYATEELDKAFQVLISRGMRPLQRPTIAAAFVDSRIAWLIGRDLAVVELVEKSSMGGIYFRYPL
jgi:methylmalonyl-CoA/ethylmalonyl-CoA epimerase